MALKPLKPTDVAKKKSIFSMIYGESGIGKTALAFTAGRCYMFDADDGGALRAHNRGFITLLVESDMKKRALEDPDSALTIDEFLALINNGRLINEIKAATGDDVDSIIIDNMDNFYNMIIKSCIRKNPSLEKNNMKLYGTAKPIMRDAMSGLKLTEKNVTTILHVKNGEQKATPNGPESMINILSAICDVYGRMYVVEENGRRLRCISFSPDDKGVGKNPGKLSTMYIPEFEGPSFWFSDKVITPTLNTINSVSTVDYETCRIIENFSEKIKLATTANDINALAKEMGDLQVKSERAYSIIRPKIGERIKELPIFLNAETKQYEDVQTAN